MTFNAVPTLLSQPHMFAASAAPIQIPASPEPPFPLTLKKLCEFTHRILENEKIHAFTAFIFRIIQAVARIFGGMLSSIAQKLQKHDNAIRGQRICSEFIVKIEKNEIDFHEPQKALLNHIFCQNTVIAESAELAYLSCQSHSTAMQLQLLAKDLQAGKDYHARFDALPDSLKTSLYKAVCFSCNKLELDAAFAQKLINDTPQILLTAQNDAGDHLLAQLAAIQSDFSRLALDSAILWADGTPQLDKLSPATAVLIDLPAYVKFDNAGDKTAWLLHARTTLKNKLNELEGLTNGSFGSTLGLYNTSANKMAESLPPEELNRPLTVTMVGVEFAGMIQQGGLAEALGGMSKALAKSNPKNKVRLIFPKFNKLPQEITSKLQPSPVAFKDSKGQPINVSIANVDGVECYFIEHSSFKLGDKNPSIYGPKEKDARKRFAAFSSMAADLLYQMKDNDVIHLHDWHVAGVGLKLSSEHRDEWLNGKIPPIVFTFHNHNKSCQGLPYSGLYSYNAVTQALKSSGIQDPDSNLFVTTLDIADSVTTVSETFGKEAQMPQLGEGVSFAIRKAARMGKLAGIINGVDTGRFDPQTEASLKNWIDPATKTALDLAYSPENAVQKKQEAKQQLKNWVAQYMPQGRHVTETAHVHNPKTRKLEADNHFDFDFNKPTVTYIGRFDSYQKGMDKLDEAIQSTLKNGGQFILMGSQEDQIAKKILNELERKYPSGVLFIRDFKDANGKYHYQQGSSVENRPPVGSLVRAASDFVFVPSSFEPCGLVQFEAWLFGSQVIASNTGGLADTVLTREKSAKQHNGYLFERDGSKELGAGNIIQKALSDWQQLASKEKSELTSRLMQDGKKYSWSTASQRRSPIESYQIVYHRAIQRVKQNVRQLTHSPLSRRFDFREYVPAVEIPKQPIAPEELYLEKYYSRQASSEELTKDYFAMPKEKRMQLPSPYGVGVNYQKHTEFGVHFNAGHGTFGVEAPQAATVSVRLYDDHEHLIGEFPLGKDQNGWTATIPCQVGQRYHYVINNQIKIDPFGRQIIAAADPKKAPYSVVVDSQKAFAWTDQAWTAQRKSEPVHKKPMSIYELYPQAWFRKPDGSLLNYRELAEKLVKHCKESGFTHVELMGILEHPTQKSMGYQVTSFFSPCSRMGTVDDFKYMVNYLHQHHVGVILDWVPAHFAIDDYSLINFDGSNQYEPSSGEAIHSKRHWWYQWGTKFFDFRKKAVREFLISSAMYWIKEMHVDGLRVDAVSSILYSEERNAGKQFLGDLNAVIHKHGEGALSIAEDYSGYTKTTQNAYLGGLGFDLKWNISWQKNALHYFSQHPNKRQGNYQDLVNALEGDKFHKMVLAFSHDEVKDSLRTLLHKAEGLDHNQRYANLRSMLCFMMVSPGKKLNFMGNEFGNDVAWTEFLGKNKGLLDADQLNIRQAQTQKMMAALNKLYLEKTALSRRDRNAWDLEWIEKNDDNQSLLAFRRQNPKGSQIACLHNFAGDKTISYQISVKNPKLTKLKEIFNSDHSFFGGEGRLNASIVPVYDNHKRIISYTVQVPPLTTIMIEEDIE